MARKEGKWRRLFFSPSAPILECYVTDSHFARLTYSLRFETELTLKLDLGIKQDGETDFPVKRRKATAGRQLKKKTKWELEPNSSSSSGASIYDVRTEGEGGQRNTPNVADKQFRFCGQRGGRGQKSRNSVDVIYGSPLSSRPFVRFGESAARMVIATNTLYCGVAFWCHDEL